MRLRAAGAAALLAGLLGTPAHAGTTAMNARMDLTFDCYGCGATRAYGTLTCLGPCQHDGILCVTACVFPVEATAQVDPVPLCLTPNLVGSIFFGGDDAFFLMTVAGGPAAITMRYGTGSTATGLGGYAATPPAPCGAVDSWTGTFVGTFTG